MIKKIYNTIIKKPDLKLIKKVDEASQFIILAGLE